MKKLLERRLLLDTPIFQVTDNYLIDPAGHEIRRILVEHGGSTVAMPVDEKRRQVLLVRQYRFPVRRYLWELPAGKIDPGETALQAARRELREETGYRARRWKRLLSFYPSPGFQQEKMTIYLATDLIPGARSAQEDEDLEVAWFPLAKVEEEIARGRIVDAKTILGVQMYRRR